MNKEPRQFEQELLEAAHDSGQCPKDCAYCEKDEWTIETALTQIKMGEYQCEGGPLKNNVAWMWLEKHLAG